MNYTKQFNVPWKATKAFHKTGSRIAYKVVMYLALFVPLYLYLCMSLSMSVCVACGSTEVFIEEQGDALSDQVIDAYAESQSPRLHDMETRQHSPHKKSNFRRTQHGRFSIWGGSVSKCCKYNGKTQWHSR